MFDIKDYLEKSGGLHKFGGIAPEGFILIHEQTLEQLKDFDTWKSWKNKEISLHDLDVKNFNNL